MIARIVITYYILYRWQGHHSSPPSQQLDEKTVEEEQEEMVVADQAELDEDGRVVDVEEVQKVWAATPSAGGLGGEVKLL